MITVHGIDHVPEQARGAALAIGNFDGVHRGHQALLTAAIAVAARLHCPAGAIVFEPHPREFFQPDHPHFRLSPLRRKLALLEMLGLGVGVVIPFDASLAALSADAFIERVLAQALAARHVVVGYDFRFGKGRAGDVELLRQAGGVHGFGVTVVPQMAESGEVFSSSGVRAMLAQGDVRGAAQMLGHWWRVGGTVVGGAQRGRGLGFPTANLALSRGTALAHGIYAVRVYSEGKRRDGAAYLGTRPTFDDGEAVLEVFLLDFDGNLYGRDIEVEFIDFVRGDAKFAAVADLETQMAKDCARAREILATAPAEPVQRTSS
jgi:riboflavin kinase / FMN adenylyltransferase